MAVGPPKCKTCGKVEWRHVCFFGGGKPAVREVRDLVVKKVVERPRKAVVKKSKAAAKHVDTTPPKAVNLDRKEYLRLKARERRAAEKLGLSLAEFRALEGRNEG